MSKDFGGNHVSGTWSKKSYHQEPETEEHRKESIEKDFSRIVHLKREKMAKKMKK